jgi:hypothetical protein
MADTLSDVKRGLRDEIGRLQNEVTRLQDILSQLETVGGNGATAAPAKRGPGRPPKAASAAAGAPVAVTRRRGRPKGKTNTATSAEDIQAALRKIEEAGKNGIGARALQVALKKDGIAKPSKSDLLASEKVKTRGFGGATSYVWNG